MSRVSTVLGSRASLQDVNWELLKYCGLDYAFATTLVPHDILFELVTWFNHLKFCC